MSAVDQALAPPSRGRRRTRRLLGGAASLAVHGALLLALFATWRHQASPPEPPPVTVSLMPGPILTPAPEPPAPTPMPADAQPAAAVDKPPPHEIARIAQAPPDLATLAADETPAPVAELGDGDLAGAGTAETGGGGGGGACNMVRLIQNALRRDALVQSAVIAAHRAAGAPGKAILVWNGDWVRNLDQDGKGLAAVREAILWEVGFAPAACRTQSVHGLVAISLGDAPGLPELALGGGDWRWSDLLLLHPAR